MGDPILIDDRDPAIQYDSNWYTGGVAEEYASTVHLASVEGAQATLIFTGTSVTVYGTLHAPDTPGMSSYSIDGKPATNVMGSTSSKILYQHPLYRSPTLGNGEHTLTITLVVWQGGGFSLDYFSVTPNQITPQPVPHTTSLAAPAPIPPSNTVVISRSAEQNHPTIKATPTPGTEALAGPTMSTPVVIAESAPQNSVLPSSHPGVGFNSSSSDNLSIPHPSTSITPPTQTLSPPVTTGTKPTSRIGIIVGSVVGSIVLILMVIAILFVLRASRRRKALRCASPTDTTSMAPLMRETLSFRKSPITYLQQRSEPPPAQTTYVTGTPIREFSPTPSIGAPPTYIERVSQTL